MLSSGLGTRFLVSRLGTAAILGFGAHWLRVLHALTSGGLLNGIGVVVETSVTMLGFVLATVAILGSVLNTRLLRNMQKTNHYAVLIGRMFFAIVVLGITALLGIVFIFHPAFNRVFPYVLLGLVLLSAFLLGDMIRKFWKVMMYLHPDLQKTL